MGWLSAGRHHRALTATARRCVVAGWPVVPGSWWSPAKQRHVCDMPACLVASLHPVVPGVLSDAELMAYALTDVAAVAARWARRPYAVLVPTGVACDVVEVPRPHGPVVIDALARHGRGVIAANGRGWLIFTRPGGPSPGTVDAPGRREWAGLVIVHGAGSWVAIPPSVVAGRALRWIWPPPRQPHWPLPDQRTVLAALGPVL